MTKSNLNIFLINIDGVSKKIHEIESLLSKHNLYLLCITETKLTENIPNERISVPGYSIIRKDREGQKGGGIMIFYKHYLKIQHVTPQFNLNSCEFIFCTVSLANNSSLNVVLIYRPPRSNLDSFLDSLELFCSTHSYLYNMPFCFLGDLNIDLNEGKPNSSLIQYKNLLTSFNLTQIVSFPTRICMSRASVIDHVTVNSLLNISSCTSIDCSFTDHQGVKKAI